jgi:DNA-binding NarL/FixJ family response regulator
MKASKQIRVLCADDHPSMRKGIASIIANEPDMKLVGEAGNGYEAVDLFCLHRPDVTLMDLRMPGPDGIAAIRMIQSHSPEARIIVLTSYDSDQDIYRAVEAGVCGYLLKETAHTEIVRAIRMAHAGKRLIQSDIVARLRDRPRVALTTREIEVLSLAAQGLANKEIGARLGTTVGTIKIHIQNILSKLQASDRTHAVTIAFQRGILHLSEFRSIDSQR